MKTNSTNPLARLTGITAVLALFMALGGLANAQEKGATQLLRLGERALTPKAAPIVAQTTGCSMCKDVFVSRVDWTARGANKPTVTSARHLCGSCTNDSVVTGFGRAKTMTAVHKCGGCCA
jgi:hypothetical protein